MSSLIKQTVPVAPYDTDSDPPTHAEVAAAVAAVVKPKAVKNFHALKMTLLTSTFTFGVMFAVSAPNLLQVPKLMMAGGEAAVLGQVQAALSAVAGLIATFCGVVAFTLVPRAESTVAKLDQLLELAKAIVAGAQRHDGEAKVSLAETTRLREMLANLGISLGDLHMNMFHRSAPAARVEVAESAPVQHIQIAFRSETGLVVSHRPGMVSEIRETEVIDGTRLDMIGDVLVPSYARLVRGNGVTGWRVIFARTDWRLMAKFFFGLDRMHQVATRLGLDMDFGKLQIKLYDPPPGEPRETLVIIPRNGANKPDILKYSAGGVGLPPLIKLAGDEYDEALGRLVEIDKMATAFRAGTVRNWLGVKVGSDNILRRNAAPPEGWPDENAADHGGWGGC